MTDIRALVERLRLRQRQWVDATGSEFPSARLYGEAADALERLDNIRLDTEVERDMAMEYLKEVQAERLTRLLRWLRNWLYHRDREILRLRRALIIIREHSLEETYLHKVAANALQSGSSAKSLD